MLVNHKNISLTLVLSVLLGVAAAHDFPARQHHDGLKRLVRKRQDGGLFGGAGIINVVPDPNSTTDSASGSASAATDSASASASASASSDSASASASTTDSQSASASASAQSQSSTTTTSTSTTATTTDTPTTTIDTSTHSTSTVTHTASVTASANNVNDIAGPNSAASEKKSTITTIIIVIAASVGGVAILWTVFRKWKLGHSSKFDERMAPIDWQPTNDDDIVPAHRRAPSRASSHGHTTDLNHDLTAPATHLAPVGGYADLTRGASPQPQMQESLNRGPSFNRGYGATLPLHHQNNFGQAEAYDYNGDAVRF